MIRLLRCYWIALQMHKKAFAKFLFQILLVKGISGHLKINQMYFFSFLILRALWVESTVMDPGKTLTLRYFASARLFCLSWYLEVRWRKPVLERLTNSCLKFLNSVFQTTKEKIIVVFDFAIIFYCYQTFVVVSKRFGKLIVYRFSREKSLYLFSPRCSLRQNMIYLATSQYPLCVITENLSLYILFNNVTCLLP